MKPFSLVSTLFATVVYLTIAPFSHATDSQTTMTGKELAARLSEQRQNGSSYVRLRMDINGATKETLQLQIKERRMKSSTEVVYQVLFPKERKGESVLVRKIENRAATGSIFVPPNTLRSIDDLKGPLLGSDLAYEDIVDNFFAWDQQTIIDTEKVDGEKMRGPRIKTGQRRALDLWQREKLDRPAATRPASR
jgi:hypothetical protein